MASAITGESKPVNKTAGSEVIGGSVNGDGSIEVEVLSSGENSYLNKVIRLVEDAQATKSKTQNLADKAAGWLAYIAIGIGVTTFIIWAFFTSKGNDFALERMVTVMIITCPHALGLAIPLVASISTALSVKNGLLIRNRTAFEGSRKISTIIFDKTGTLTTGKFGVRDITPLKNIDEHDILSIAASLETPSEHPIGKGIVALAKERKIALKDVTDFTAEKGTGIKAKLGGVTYRVVSPGYLDEHNIPIDPAVSLDNNRTTVFLLKGNEALACISLTDQIREESLEAVKALKDQNIQVWMATGDNDSIAKSVAEELDLDGYDSEVKPHEKFEIIRRFQQEGEFVVMAGDGVNDAPALAAADVGIAVGSGTDIAAETADVILTNSRPTDISAMITFGKATYQKMVQNLIWATGYNVVAIPLAAGVLYYQGIMISPAVGAVLMSISTIVCAANAQLLRYKLK